MKVINIAEAKAKLSEYLDAAAAGERVLICKRNQPVAELRAVAQARVEPRPLGKAAGKLAVPSSFFEPLPDDVLDAFGAGTGHGRPTRSLPRVAEESPPYHGTRKGRRR